MQESIHLTLTSTPKYRPLKCNAPYSIKDTCMSTTRHVLRGEHLNLLISHVPTSCVMASLSMILFCVAFNGSASHSVPGG